MQTPTFAFVAQLARRAGFALLPVIVASASLTLAATAEAQQAYVSARTNLRAGPDRGYPAVAWLGTGTSVYVHGCVRGYYWCDVSSGSVRGWANKTKPNCSPPMGKGTSSQACLSSCSQSGRLSPS